MTPEQMVDLRVRDAQAIAAAVRMRRDEGASFPVIAQAMRDQFGIYRGAESWRYYCNQAGVEGRPNRLDIQRAYELRGIGLGYRSISALMAHDHGVHLTGSGWRYRLLQAHPDIEKRPRGRAYTPAVAA